MPLPPVYQPHGDPSPPPPSHPPPKPNTKILSLILKSIIMVFITSLFFLLMGLASLLLLPLLLASIHRHHRNHPSSEGFCSKRLKKLPQFKLSKKMENDCVVCLDGFKQGQWCRKLVGCGHVFPQKCVDTWLIKVPACPICRSTVQLEDDKEEFWTTFGRRRRNHGFRLC
ncbi:LOW QUALITY PROTEIN: RING-H2 finger protein ATL56 [Carica papaya]|uniref:LOW QUALITY PROTEIN: RING-H2 finger protein ATL56 n=1 Tax=Carica papaya TaxID=3649 RepID=UPI000B8CB503|nr:LOW QUALITY PROTEIN: RING-H2 finger protein ATL56 [Carica papaya]